MFFLRVLSVFAVSSSAWADSIRLHDQAGSVGPMVTLDEVAELEGAYAVSLGEMVIGAFREGAPRLKITLDAVQAALSRADANLGKLALQGHNTCRVHRTSASAQPVSNHVSPAVANVETEIGLGTAMSLRDLLIDKIEQITGVNRADLRIAISPRDEKRLHRSAFNGRIELEPVTSAKLGRQSFTIRRYGGGAVPETFTVTADVARRALGLVATRTIQRGEVFAADAIEVRELWLEDNRGAPLTGPSLVVGQQASKLLREGTVICPEHVQSPVLVRRGELITVRCLSGRLVIRTIARARHDGALDDVIPVKNEKTRETFFITVTGRREGTIHMASSDDSGDDA